MGVKKALLKGLKDAATEKKVAVSSIKEANSKLRELGNGAYISENPNGGFGAYDNDGYKGRYDTIEEALAIYKQGGESDYRIQHRAPRVGQGNTLDNLSEIYPDDVYSGSKAAQYYGHGDRTLDLKTANIIKSYRNNPEKEITIYRAVPKGVTSINEGDWVTINKDYAKVHGDANLDEGYDIIESKVKAKDIASAGDSIHEWGYKTIAPLIPTAAVAGGALYTPEENQAQASMIGQAAKTFNKEALAYAQKLEAQGAPMEAIRKATGYQFGTPIHRGVDGKWRQEISDADATMAGRDFKQEIAQAAQAGDVDLVKRLGIEKKNYRSPHEDTNVLSNVLSHDDLYSAYRDAKAIGYRKDRNADLGSASYSPDADFITMSDTNREATISPLLHETQHAIQKREGFARGGSSDYLPSEALDVVVNDFEKEFGHLPAVKKKKESSSEREYKEWARDMYASSKPRGMHDLSFDYYQRLAGEEEARQTQKRLPLSMIERIERNPNLDFDTPPEQQIVRWQTGTSTAKGMSTLAALSGGANAIYNAAKNNTLGEAANYAQDAANMVGYIPTAGMLTTSDIIGGIGKAGAAATGNLDAYNANVNPYIERAGETQSQLGKQVEQAIGYGAQQAAPYVMPYVTPVYNNVMKQWEQIEATPGDANLFGFIDELNRKSNAKLFR